MSSDKVRIFDVPPGSWFHIDSRHWIKRDNEVDLGTRARMRGTYMMALDDVDKWVRVVTYRGTLAWLMPNIREAWEGSCEIVELPS